MWQARTHEALLLVVVLAAMALAATSSVSDICKQVNYESKGRLVCEHNLESNTIHLKYGAGAWEAMSSIGRRQELLVALCGQGVSYVSESRWRPWGRKLIVTRCAYYEE